MVAGLMMPAAGGGYSCSAEASRTSPGELEWFYMDVASVQQGPLQLQDMRALYDAGAVHDGTFVWNETMGDWDTYGRCLARFA